MGDFGKLPLELREAILADVTKVDLSALSCTSKWMRDAIEPNLYRDIEWDWGDSDLHHRPVHLLVRTLLIRPTLSTYVKSVDFAGGKPFREFQSSFMNVRLGPTCSVWTVEDVPDFSKQEMRLAIRLIHSLRLSCVDLWLQELKRGEVDVFVALLLAQSYNLRRLRLDFEFQTTKFVGSLLGRAALRSGHCPFSALETVDYSGDINDKVSPFMDHTIDFTQVLELFRLPSIQSMRMALPVYSIPWTEQNSPTTFTLTSLVLHHTQLSEIDLGHLLRASPNLKSLEFHLWYNLSSSYRQRGDRQIYLDCVDLSTSLAFVRASLQHLVVDIGFGYHGRVLAPSEGMNGRLDGLQHFVKLSSLEIPSIMLLGWDLDKWTPEIPRTLADVMPPNLSQLCFTDHLTHLEGNPWNDEHLLSLIEAYLEARHTSQPYMDKCR